MQALLIAFLAINLTHGYLILRHRGKHRPTISERAVEDDLSLSLYITAHLVGGLAFGIFSFELFYHNFNSPILFGLAAAGILAEWLQAIIPARGKYESAHTTLAYLMSVFMVAMGIIAIATLTLPSNTKLALIILELIILAGYPITAALPYKYFWAVQLVNINVFYLQMYLLAIVA